MAIFGTQFVGYSQDYYPEKGWTSQNTYPRLLVDVNGDGRADIVGFGSGRVVVSLGKADGTFGTQFVGYSQDYYPEKGWVSQDKYPRLLGDVNGDGRADIVAFGSGRVAVSLGKANGTFGTQFVGYSQDYYPEKGWVSQDKYPRLLDDVNGDRRADIVAFGSGRVAVSLGKANGTFGTQFVGYSQDYYPEKGWASQDKYPRLLGDVNGDGRADIVAFGSGRVAVSLGKANGTFGTQFVGYSQDYYPEKGWVSQDKYPRLLGDVNGDGRADIVAFGSGRVAVSLGKANGTFGTQFVGYSQDYYPEKGWVSQDKYPRLLDDVNGDRRADIVGFGSGRVAVSLGKASNNKNSFVVTSNDNNSSQGEDVLIARTRGERSLFATNKALNSQIEVDEITDFSKSQDKFLAVSIASNLTISNPLVESNSSINSIFNPEMAVI